MSNIVNDDNNLGSSINNITEDHNAIATDTSDSVSYNSSLNGDITQTCHNNVAKKIEQLICCLNSDILSCDFTWSLFQSALNSYRFDSCLRPYPSMFLKNGYKDPAKMRTLSDQVPDMQTLKTSLSDKKYVTDTINLLHWVLLNQREPYLKPIIDSNSQPKNSVLFQYISKKQLTVAPNYIYELVYSPQSEAHWQLRKNDKTDSIYAFHGSRLDNFYSIVKFGLQQHMSGSEKLFGDGIYLSSELMLSLIYSPAGIAWEKSMCGSVFSIVALCEIINDTEKVKCQDVSHKKRCVNVGSIGGSVPDKYYVVLNSDLVRVRYLLVFKHSSPESSKKVIRPGSIFFSWLQQHKMFIMLILYILLLFFIGFVNSSTWCKYQRIFRNYFDEEQ